MHPKDSLGREGEQAAADFLVRAGMQILARNWRTAGGEIDIVAVAGRTLVVCEVKTRSNLRYGTPAEAVDRRKLARLRRLAVRWLLSQGLMFEEIRIDVIGVLKDASGHLEIEHLPGVG